MDFGDPHVYISASPRGVLLEAPCHPTPSGALPGGRHRGRAGKSRYEGSAHSRVTSKTYNFRILSPRCWGVFPTALPSYHKPLEKDVRGVMSPHGAHADFLPQMFS